MSILIIILLSLATGVSVILSFPVLIQLDEGLTVLIKWIFVKVRIRFDKGALQTQIKVFGRRIRKKEPLKAAESGDKSGDAGPKKRKPLKITFSLVLEIIQDTAVKKVIRQLFQFCVRWIHAFRIRLLKCDIGLKTYDWQGVIMGLMGSVPYTERLQIAGNFNQENDFRLVLSMSLWKTLLAVSLFLLGFPYYRAIRLYLKIRKYR